MIDIETEQLLTFRAAAEWLAARTGTPAPSQNTLRRWALVGLRGVVLDAVRVGRWPYTSVEALQRFVSARDAPDRPAPAVSRRRARERAEADRRAAEVFG
jgi:hypothetical protein